MRRLVPQVVHDRMPNGPLNDVDATEGNPPHLLIPPPPFPEEHANVFYRAESLIASTLPRKHLTSSCLIWSGEKVSRRKAYFTLLIRANEFVFMPQTCHQQHQCIQTLFEGMNRKSTCVKISFASVCILFMSVS